MKQKLNDVLALKAISQSKSWWQHIGTLFPILLVYLSLACYGIDRQSLWTDEVFSIRDAASMATLWSKSHGPLHFALLHVWMQLGTSEPILRSLSVLMGGVAVCLLYATSSRLVNRRVTIVATLLLATSPFLIWYSQEVRYITLMIATSLLTVYTLHRLAARGRLAWWFAYGSAFLLALLSFVTNIFLPVVQGLYLGSSPARRP